jgi:hypothetical protein
MSGSTPLSARHTTAPGPFSSAQSAASSASKPEEMPEQNPLSKARASAQRQGAADKFVAASHNPFSTQKPSSNHIDISGLSLSRPSNDTVAISNNQKTNTGNAGSNIWTAGKFAFGAADSALTNLGQGLGLPAKPFKTSDPSIRAGQTAGHLISLTAGIAGFAAGGSAALNATAAGAALAVTPGGQAAAVPTLAAAGVAASGAAISASWAVTGASNLGKEINSFFAQSPNSAGRKAVQGHYIDPMTNKTVKTDKTLAADHIVPQKEIKAAPGFDKLSEQQKSDVLNLPENLQGLPKTFNSSKGAKTADAWVEYKKQSINPDYIERAKKLQDENRTKIKSMIDGFNQPSSP